jgi:pseudaminic acid synthase
MNISINNRKIGPNYPVYIVAEMSANHNQNFDIAVNTIRAAKEAGADAVKLQTYTADTLTIDADNEYFQIRQGTPWDGKTLYKLYQEAYTPWDWQPKLKEIANNMGLVLFSTPFDTTSVDFLEKIDVPAYKVASFELVDLQLIEYIASKGKPIIMSTGMATYEEIADAVAAARNAGATEIALLKCTSAYPAKAEEMNLRIIPYLAETFNVVTGLSDHTLEAAIPVASVALGASIIEKHFILQRSLGGPDATFSLEPHEFREMVKSVRAAEKALGTVTFGPTDDEVKSKVFRRSLFVIKDMKAGEVFTDDNIRSIRPGYGLPPKCYKEVLGKQASIDISKGTPLSWALIRQKILKEF